MKWKPYPSCKSSGVEWLGEVPAHWDTKPLGYLARFRGGATPDKSRPDFWDGDIPWVSPKDMKRPRLADAEDHVTDRALSGSALSMIPPGAVLIVVRGMILAHSFPVAVADGPLTINQDMKALLPGPDVGAEYLARVLTGVADVLVALADESAHGTRKIESAVLSRFALPLPPPDDQSAVCQFLDRETARLDGLVAKKRALVERLREKRTALISRTVTSGLPPEAARAAGQAPHPKLKPSGIPWLGDIPEHWRVAPVKRVATIGNGSTPQRDNEEYWTEGSYPWLTSTVVNEKAVTSAVEFVTERALRDCHLPRIMPPAVLVGITGEGRTRGMATTLRIEATINQHIAFLKPRPNYVAVDYLRRVLDRAYPYLRNESDGGGSTKGAITCEQLGELAVPLPPPAEQQAIAEYLDRETARIDNLVEKVEAAIERLQEYRQALITAAVTGKIDVRDHARVAVEIRT